MVEESTWKLVRGRLGDERIRGVRGLVVKEG
jgi:hypothetical protein